jgi:hypothetical protein
MAVPSLAPFSAGQILTSDDMNETAEAVNSLGLFIITSGTVTSGTSFDLTSVFTSDYDSYKLVLTQIRTAAGTPSIQLRLLATSTPATTGYYYGVSRVDISLVSINVIVGNNATLIDTGSIQNGAVSGMMSCEIHSPISTQYTSLNGQSVDSRAAGAYGGISWSGQLANATSYNGIRILLSSSSFTNCNYKLYGYRNSYS